jgi:hypothetical protein
MTDNQKAAQPYTNQLINYITIHPASTAYQKPMYQKVKKPQENQVPFF